MRGRRGGGPGPVPIAGASPHVAQSALLHIVLRSVLLNGWSLLLTALLTVIVVYLFVVIGYVFFREDFVGAAAGEGVCSTLLECFAFGVLNGLRAGGGLGDLLPQRVHSFRILVSVPVPVLVCVCARAGACVSSVPEGRGFCHVIL